MRSTVAGHREVTTTNWEDHWSWSSYNHTRSCQRTQHPLFRGCSAFEADRKGEQTLINGCLMSWLKIKKSSCWSVIFSCFIQQWTTFHSDCDEQQKGDCIWQLAVTSSVDGLRGSRAPPKPNFHQHKQSWSLFGGLLPAWSTTAFWILVKPFCLRTTLSKLMRCTENCNAYSRHWSAE